jgi:hypothetical protein
MRFDCLGGFLCYYGVSGWEAFTWVAVGIEGKICFNSFGAGVAWHLYNTR